MKTKDEIREAITILEYARDRVQSHLALMIECELTSLRWAIGTEEDRSNNLENTLKECRKIFMKATAHERN